LEGFSFDCGCELRGFLDLRESLDGIERGFAGRE